MHSSDECVCIASQKREEKHENEIIEIKMVLNITHGATNTFVHTHTTHSHIEIYLFYWPLFSIIFCSSVPQTPAPNKNALCSKSPVFLSSLFELSHFIRVDKTIFYPCRINRTTTKNRPIVTVESVHHEKSHRPETSCEWKEECRKKSNIWCVCVCLGSGILFFNSW